MKYGDNVIHWVFGKNYIGPYIHVYLSTVIRCTVKNVFKTLKQNFQLTWRYEIFQL